MKHYSRLGLRNNDFIDKETKFLIIENHLIIPLIFTFSLHKYSFQTVQYKNRNYVFFVDFQTGFILVLKTEFKSDQFENIRVTTP